jgi:drug/metabolite transporter (DMT)-like permease
VSATIGQFFLTKAFSAGSPTRVSVVGLSQIVFVLLLDILFQGQSLTLPKGLGILLVAAPTAWLVASRATG